MKLQRIIKLKMSGDDILFMKKRLKELGFHKDKIDNYYGQTTLVSVTNFQRHIGIKPDGVVGSQTWNRLLNLENKVIVKKEEDILQKISFVSDSGLKIYDHLLNDNEFYKDETQKNTIFIHNSNSCSRPDWRIGNWDKRWEKDNSGFHILDNSGKPKEIRVGSHYVIGRKSSSSDINIWDGKVLRAIDDKYCINHLDINSANNQDLNFKSISIEICNYGHLVHRDGSFYNSVNKLVRNSDVVELEDSFRGYKYWEKYTDNQIENLRKLILHLKQKYNIEIEKDIYDKSWFEYSDKWFSLGGLRNYSQVNRDIFGIFPQKEIIQMLNSL